MRAHRGETAEMPGFTATTTTNRRLHRRSGGRGTARWESGPRGDILIGLPSAGLHTNGYSLARRIFFEQLGYDPQSIIPGIGKIERPCYSPHLLSEAIAAADRAACAACACAHHRRRFDRQRSRVLRIARRQDQAGSWPVPPNLSIPLSKRATSTAKKRCACQHGRRNDHDGGPDQVDVVSKHFAQIGQPSSSSQRREGSRRVAYDAPPTGYASWIE